MTLDIVSGDILYLEVLWGAVNPLKQGDYGGRSLKCILFIFNLKIYKKNHLLIIFGDIFFSIHSSWPLSFWVWMHHWFSITKPRFLSLLLERYIYIHYRFITFLGRFTKDLLIFKTQGTIGNAKWHTIKVV